MPRFSIIVPVYNVGVYLSQCLDSICAQTFSDFEAIVVDDGSPDDAPAICDNYAQKDARIKVFHKENGGVSTALNLGLEHAKGDWIYFVDGDDWIEPNTLETINKNIEKHPELDILGFNNFYNEIEREYKNKPLSPIEKILENTEIERLAVSTINPKWIERKYGYSLPVIRGRWSKAFRRDLIYSSHLQYKPELTTGQDAFFVLECFLRASKVMLVNEYLYHYRIYENSRIHKFRDKWDHVFARMKLTKELCSDKNIDFSIASGLLTWGALRQFFERFLFHRNCTLSNSEKKKQVQRFFDQAHSKDIRLSLQILRHMPEYYPILFFMKHRCAALLLLLGKLIYGRKR